MTVRRPSLTAVTLGSALVATLLVVPAAWHGASRGLHLHVTPDPAVAGSEVEVDVEVGADDAIRELRIAFAENEAREMSPDKPVRRVTVRLVVPQETEGETVSLHAEVRTVSGRTLRASAIVRLAESGDDARDAGPADQS